jgi:hypothetical protein
MSIFSNASRASSRRPARASAPTYQNEHAEKVPTALIPVVADPFGLRGDLVPPVTKDVPVPAVVGVDRVDELAVDVERRARHHPQLDGTPTDHISIENPPQATRAACSVTPRPGWNTRCAATRLRPPPSPGRIRSWSRGGEADDVIGARSLEASKDAMKVQKAVTVDKPLDTVFNYLSDFTTTTTTTEWDSGRLRTARQTSTGRHAQNAKPALTNPSGRTRAGHVGINP